MTAQTVQCPDCDTVMSTNADFCPGCGKPRTHVREQLDRQAQATGETYENLLRRARANGIETAAPESLLAIAEYPFGVKSLREERFYHRLLNRQPKENALIEINNLLAPGIRTVTRADIQQIAGAYELDPYEEFDEQLADMYRDYLAYCYADERLSADERGELNHLQRLFNLESNTVDRIEADIALAVFERAVDRTLADEQFSPDERVSLESLQKHLALSDESGSDVINARALSLLQRYFDSAVADERLSPAEDQRLAGFADSLGIDLRYDEDTVRTANRFREYWRIEHGELPPVHVGINLYKSEQCYAVRNAEWYEYRRKTRSIGYSGPTARIRIAKGLYWRAGSLGINRQSEDVLEKVDEGRIFLTNKRLLFMGQRRNKRVRLNRILDYRPYSNGIEIRKDAGANPFLAFEDDVDLFALTLERLIQDYG